MKKITSLTLGISFLIMTYTGVMLFLCPHGRVAYWSDWHLFGLSKNQYGEVHTTSMLVMLIFGILHIYYNWKPIVSYMKDKSKQISFTKKEFLFALGINLFFVIGTLYFIQPFKVFLDFEENFKDSWTIQYGEPPYGHAEQSKLKVFCKKMDIDLENAKIILDKNNIKFDVNEELLTISKNNGVSPSFLYELIKNKKLNKNNTEDAIPSRLGQKTLNDLLKLKKINLEKSLKILKEKGLNDVNKDSKIKNIADELDITPIDIYNIIKNK